MFSLHSFIKKYAIERYIDSSVIAAIDVLISVLATIVSLVCLRYIGLNEDIGFSLAIRLILLNVVATSISVLVIRTHRIIIRHSTIGDIWKFAVAAILSNLLMWGCLVFVLKYQIANLTLLLLINALLTFCF